MPEPRFPNQGPINLADQLPSEVIKDQKFGGEIPSPIRAKEAPAPDVNGGGKALLEDIPTTFFNPIEHTPPLGGREMSPPPDIYVDPAFTSMPDVPYVDMRRPDAVIPGAFLPQDLPYIGKEIIP